MYINEEHYTNDSNLPLALTFEPHGINWLDISVAKPTDSQPILVSYIAELTGEPMCEFCWYVNEGFYRDLFDEVPIKDLNTTNVYAWAPLPRPCFVQRYWEEKKANVL